MAQDLTAPDITTAVLLAINETNVLDNLQRQSTFNGNMVLQFNTLNAEVQALSSSGVAPGTLPTIDRDAFNRHLKAVTYDRATQTLIFTQENDDLIRVPIGDTVTTAEVTRFLLADIPTHITDEASLVGDHVLTYHIAERANLATLNLELDGTVIHNLPLPTTDGEQTVTFNISQAEWDAAIAGDPATLAFQLVGTDTSAGAVTSSSILVIRAEDSDTFFFGQSASNNPGSVALSSLTARAIRVSPDQFDVTIGPTVDDGYVILLYPATHAITSIINTAQGMQPVLDAFTISTSVRTEDGQLFDAAVFGPTEADFTLTLRITVSEII